MTEKEEKKRFFGSSDKKEEEPKKSVQVEDKKEEKTLSTELKIPKPKKGEKVVMLPVGYDQYGNPNYKPFPESKVEEQLKKLK